MSLDPPQTERWHEAADYWWTAEAIAYLAAARLAVAALPFRAIAKWMSHPTVGGDGAAAPRRMAVAVERAARRVPWRAVCIHQGIACQRMLRRRGVPSDFVYGLTSVGGELKAHVWVEWNGEILIGDHVGTEFAQVARFPPEVSRARHSDELLERDSIGS